MTNNEAMETNATTNWLTLKKAAQYLKMGRLTLYKLLRGNPVSAHKAGEGQPSNTVVAVL
jgi:excisionase family DNA binding protein